MQWTSNEWRSSNEHFLVHSIQTWVHLWSIDSPKRYNKVMVNGFDQDFVLQLSYQKPVARSDTLWLCLQTSLIHFQCWYDWAENNCCCVPHIRTESHLSGAPAVLSMMFQCSLFHLSIKRSLLKNLTLCPKSCNIQIVYNLQNNDQKMGWGGVAGGHCY